MKYDIIGDIHGRTDKLEELLAVLGYAICENTGAYKHPERKALFLGDFIDGKVPEKSNQRRVIEIVKGMVEAGSALAIMGNHELNAICYGTKTDCGTSHLREHSEKNKAQHRLFLEEYEMGSKPHLEVLEWFKTLPVYLDLGTLFVTHACPSLDDLEIIKPYLEADGTLKAHGYTSYALKADKAFYGALECLLKGIECELPDGLHLVDSYGHKRTETRIKWWVEQSRPQAERIVDSKVPFTAEEKEKINSANLSIRTLTFPDKPCFVGHYWMSGEPDILAPRFACVDYSVGRHGGKLACYRFDGESELSSEKIVAV